MQVLAAAPRRASSLSTSHVTCSTVKATFVLLADHGIRTKQHTGLNVQTKMRSVLPLHTLSNPSKMSLKYLGQSEKFFSRKWLFAADTRHRL